MAEFGGLRAQGKLSFIFLKMLQPLDTSPSLNTFKEEEALLGLELGFRNSCIALLGTARSAGWEAEMASTKLEAQADFPSLPAAIPSMPPNTQDPSLWVQHRVLDPSQLPAQPTAGWMSDIPSLEAGLPELRGHIRTRRGGEQPHGSSLPSLTVAIVTEAGFHRSDAGTPGTAARSTPGRLSISHAPMQCLPKTSMQ